MIAGHRRRYRNNAFNAIERLTIDPKAIEQKIRELPLREDAADQSRCARDPFDSR
jgi:hypothetical protein